jgi:hypothetical protein
MMEIFLSHFTCTLSVCGSNLALINIYEPLDWMDDRLG